MIISGLKRLFTSFTDAVRPAPKPPPDAALDVGGIADAQQHKGKVGLFSIGGFAPASATTPRKPKIPALAPHGRPPKTPSQTPGVDEQKRDKTVTTVLSVPAYRTSTTVRFAVPESDGRELKPGDRWIIELPEDMRGAHIRTVIIGHRKAEKFMASVSGDGWDDEGAYNLVEARTTDSREWVMWQDQYGAKKFAEPRAANNPENENLHDWPSAVGMRPVDIISVTGVGKGANAVANVHFVEVEVFPPGKLEATLTEVFTPGTGFVDKHQLLPTFGGGHNCVRPPEQLDKEGLYPKALAFPASAAAVVSEKSYIAEDGALHVRLPPGKRLGGFEISVGDTVLDPSKPAAQQKNKDGHFGAIGHAKMNVSIKRDGKELPPFMRNFSIPPSGVLSGGPHEPDFETKPGDELVVRFNDRAWVMGYRVQFMKAGA